MSDRVQFLDISADEAGQRLDNYLRARLKGVPKSMIYRVIRKGEVRVNKGRAKPDRKLQAGDQVRVPPVRTSSNKDQPVPLGGELASVLQQNILLEAPGYLVINKPSGLAVHGGSGVTLGLIEALRQLRPDDRYLELVHRLDRDTSGCILVARKRAALRQLQALFRNQKQIAKHYLALVQGRWPNRRQKVAEPLLRLELASGERIVRVSPEGKAALTEFAVSERFGELATLVEARPITGRTHQIRVHAKHVGCPLLGDQKYGDEAFFKTMQQYGANRLFLHAFRLVFTDPDGEQVDISAPLPAELTKLLEQIRQTDQR